MKLPRHIASPVQSPGAGIVRANDIGALTRTGPVGVGLQQAGQAIGKVGDMAFQAYMKRKDLDNQAAAGKANSRSVEALIEGNNTISGMDLSVDSALPNEPKEYNDGDKMLTFPSETKDRVLNSTYKDYEGKIRSLSKAMGFRGEKARTKWVEGKLNEGYASLTMTANAKQQDYQQTLYLGNAATAAKNGDIEASNKWIEIAERSGLISSKQAAAERSGNAKLTTESNIASAASEAFDVWQDTGDEKKALDFIEADTRIAGDDKQEAESELLQRIGYRQALLEDQKEKQQEDDRSAVNEILYPAIGEEVEYQSAANAVNKSLVLDETEKASKLKEIRTAAANALKPTETVSKGIAIRKMETAVDDLAKGIISKNEYYSVYGENSGDLSSSHQSKYITEANPSYDKAISSVKKLADDSAKREIVTRTDEDMLEILRLSRTGEIPSLFADTSSMKNQMELINYTGYQMEVFEELKKKKWRDAPANDALPTLRSIGTKWAAKEWAQIFAENENRHDMVRKAMPIRKAYNAAFDRKLTGEQSEHLGSDWWGDLSVERRASIVETMASGKDVTLEEAIADVIGRL